MYLSIHSLYHEVVRKHFMDSFGAHPLSQVYKIKYLAIQSSSTNISERLGHSKELSDFEHGIVTNIATSQFVKCPSKLYDH